MLKMARRRCIPLALVAMMACDVAMGFTSLKKPSPSVIANEAAGRFAVSRSRRSSPPRPVMVLRAAGSSPAALTTTAPRAAVPLPIKVKVALLAARGYLEARRRAVAGLLSRVLLRRPTIALPLFRATVGSLAAGIVLMASSPSPVFATTGVYEHAAVVQQQQQQQQRAPSSSQQQEDSSESVFAARSFGDVEEEEVEEEVVVEEEEVESGAEEDEGSLYAPVSSVQMEDARGGGEVVRIPIQEKIALEHERWVAKTSMKKNKELRQLALIVPTFMICFLGFCKLCIQLADYQERAIREEDIELYGKYIATDATEISVEAVEPVEPDDEEEDLAAGGAPAADGADSDDANGDDDVDSLLK